MKQVHVTACLTLSICALFGAKYYIENHTPLSTSHRPSTISESEVGLNGKAIKQFAFGFESLISSLIWVELLQKANVTPVERGELSWEFMQLDTMSELDKAFERTFTFGAQFVSTLRRDAKGGKILLEKWTRRRPNDWRSFYTLGIHLFYEYQDYENAAPLLFKAASLPRAPQWLVSLGVRLLSESGSQIHALQTAAQLYNEIRDSEGKQRLKERVRSLNFHLQKNVWVQALARYETTKKRKPTSINDLRAEMQPYAREIASVFQDEEVPEDLAPLLKERFSFHYDKKTGTIESDVPPIEMGIRRPGVYHEGKDDGLRGY